MRCGVGFSMTNAQIGPSRAVEFLNPRFRAYFGKLGLPNLLLKSDYHILASLVAREELDAEIGEKLDAIADVAARAKPRTEGEA